VEELLTVHEWGHDRGLFHRDDPAAIRYARVSGKRKEIDTTERAAMLRY